MEFSDLITQELFLESTGKNLLLLDIDDTLLSAQGMFIYRTAEHPKGAKKLTPAEYAKEPVTPETKKFYSYKDFRNAEKVGNSIKLGIPIIKNLKIMDNYINNGWTIGVLTARGMEDVIFKSMKAFLQFRNPKGDLQEIGDKLVRNLVHAVNDDNKHYKGGTDFEKKKNVMLSLLDKYDRVWLIDDDSKNIKAVNDLKEELRNKKDKRHAKLRAILASKPEGRE